LQNLHLRGKAIAVLLLRGSDHRLEGCDVHLAQVDNAPCQRDLEQLFMQFARELMSAECRIMTLRRSFSLGQFTHGARLSKKRQLLFDAIKEIAVIRALFAIRTHHAKLRHGIFPRAHRGSVPCRGIRASVRGAQRRIVCSRFFREGFDEFGRHDDCIRAAHGRLRETSPRAADH